MSMLFRPTGNLKFWRLKERRRGSPYGRGSLSFQNRVAYYPAKWTKHQIQFARRFSKLHYLACHSPEPIRLKWKHAYNNFMNAHFGQKGNASVRYLNKYSCHKWL